MKRLSLEEHQDNIAQRHRILPYASTFFDSFDKIRGNTYLKKSIQLAALQNFHDQEMSFMQEQIPKWISYDPLDMSTPDDFLILFKTGEIIRYCEDDWPPSMITHWMTLPKQPTE